MLQEPFRLTCWKPKAGNCAGKLFTCARPGRSQYDHRKSSKVPDEVVAAWLQGLPPPTNMLVIVSLLGRKPGLKGRSEFSFYSFRGGFDQPSERPSSSTFQEWLDITFGSGVYQLIEFPTVDLELLPLARLKEIGSAIAKLLHEGKHVVVFDSGGIGRTGALCKFMDFVSDP